jgi:hypothetical protein
MDATSVAPARSQAVGNPADDVLAADLERLRKLLRLRQLKQQIRTVRSELEQLEAELFGEGPSCAL